MSTKKLMCIEIDENIKRANFTLAGEV